MRRWIGVWVLVMAIVVGVVIGVTSFNAGVSSGLARATNSSVVQVVRGPYLFPFGLFLFPFLLVGTFVLIGGAFRRRAWDHQGGSGPWAGHGNRAQMSREWHDKLHEQDAAPADPADTRPDRS
jgi:hypothetical protein